MIIISLQTSWKLTRMPISLREVSYYADAVTTVSNTYAEEIKTPFYGERLDGLMCARANSLRGIVNGIDYNDL